MYFVVQFLYPDRKGCLDLRCSIVCDIVMHGTPGFFSTLLPVMMHSVIVPIDFCLQLLRQVAVLEVD